MDLVERLRDAVQTLRRTPKPISEVAPLLTQAADKIQYLEESLVAITTGQLPDKYDLNQMLLSQRYFQWAASKHGN